MLGETQGLLTAVEAEEPNSTGQRHPGQSGPKIRCPLCRWSPSPADLWVCTCSHKWNTFATAGLCPSCFLQWAYTICPACGILSLHLDWYEQK